MDKLKYYITAVLLIFALQAKPLTVNEVLAKTAAKVNSARTISCSFSISGAPGNSRGSILSSGNKFYITSALGELWYNGKDLWTYNSSAKETTLNIPTQSELMEINPMLYLNSYGNLFISTLSKRKVSGMYVILMRPKTRKLWISELEVEINAKTFDPAAFVIKGRDGKISRLTILSLRYGLRINPSTFVYPSSKFKNVEIVDLR